MSDPLRVGILSVVPSPYQRDLFQALSLQREVSVSVYYQERLPHDSPWPEASLASYETILPGFYLRAGTVRSHVNWGLPDPGSFDLWIINASLTSLTVQGWMRGPLRRRPWVFWGERLRAQEQGWRRGIQDFLASPLSHSAGIISIGSLALGDYKKRYPRVPQTTVPYCTELEEFFKVRGRALGGGAEVTFLFCGQMIRRKGVDLLLAAFERLVQEGEKVRLILVGREADLDGWLSALAPEVRQWIDYAGFQAPDRLPDFYGRADVFILPSRHDGWGVVVNQALASGLPVLASDGVGAAHDLVRDGENGLVFRAGDGEAVYQAMKTAVQQRERLADWGRVSAQRAMEVTPESGARRLVEFIQSIVKNAG